VPQQCAQSQGIPADTVSSGVDLIEGKQVAYKLFVWQGRADTGDCEWKGGRSTLQIWADGNWKAHFETHCNARGWWPWYGYCKFGCSMSVGGNKLFGLNSMNIPGGSGMTGNANGFNSYIRDNFNAINEAWRHRECRWRH
jgi:hypothetical protein